ncbi:nucleoside hydrolase [Kiritimatiellota bacterium B12222]|nr:nucleoside hydrolase [Kiritimatiellota bacterium B12222]
MKNMPPLPVDLLTRNLQHPGKKVSMVLDTDTYNEIDDQFALAYALRSPEAVHIEAIYAAPFHNDRSTGPENGMELSYNEILNVLKRMNEPLENHQVFKGSRSFLQAKDEPVDSPAARDLVARAMAHSPEDPLYVVGIGAITNVASALLMEPRIRERIVLLWLGGHARIYPSANEFNLKQDVWASQLIFDCGAPLIWFPCLGMANILSTCLAELEKDLKGHSNIGDYLVEIVKGYHPDHYAWSKVIWDLAPIAWLVDPNCIQSIIASSPILNDDMTLSRDDSRHPINETILIHRNSVFRDVFRKLKAAPSSPL